MEKRKELFEIANYTPEIEGEFAAQYEEDQQQNKQYFLNLLSSELKEEELTSFKKNMLKLQKVVRKMGESETPDGVRLREKEKEIMQWMYDALISYALIDPQLRYTKGLEYICLGVVVSYPLFDPPKLTQLLHHFLTVLSFRELFLEGSPRYFSELNRLQLSLKQHHPLLLLKIDSNSGDLKNLFITYFRSCLLYRLTDPQPVRKIFELLFVEGVPALTTILLRIISKLEKTVLSQEPLLEFIASQLVSHYFQQLPADNSMGGLFEV